MSDEELKTLEDLKEENNKKIRELTEQFKKAFKEGIFPKEKAPAQYCENQISYDILKQEAIKEIKFFRKNRSSNPDYSKQELNGVEKYIMWKFNITEEDLK